MIAPYHSSGITARFHTNQVPFIIRFAWKIAPNQSHVCCCLAI